MDMNFLEMKIDESGLKRDYIADKLGLTRYGLRDKIRFPDRWKVTEMVALISVLNLSKADCRRIFGV